jgi:hypothetical protein
MPDLTFDQIAGGIEDGILTALKSAMNPVARVVRATIDTALSDNGSTVTVGALTGTEGVDFAGDDDGTEFAAWLDTQKETIPADTIARNDDGTIDITFPAGANDDATTSTDPKLTFHETTAGRDGMGIKSFATYSGDLDAESLTKNLMEFAAKCPRVMVSYMNGMDVQDPKTSPVLGRPLPFRHDCVFGVIVASNDIRSETIRRRGTSDTTGAYQMIAKARETLAGLVIRQVIDEETGETVPLTFEPLMPVSNEFIAKKQNMTAYAVIFKTYFRWVSPDRTGTGQAVQELVLGVESRNRHGIEIEGLPGVHTSVGE